MIIIFIDIKNYHHYYILGPKGKGFEFSKLKSGFTSLLQKISPLVTISLVLLKIAVTMYGIPLPLPGVVNFSKEDSLSYLSDTLSSFSIQYMLLKDVEESIKSGIAEDDITSKMGLTRQIQREAYDALLVFLSKPEYIPNKLGLIKCTTPSGITQWIKDDDKVIESFYKNDGNRKL